MISGSRKSLVGLVVVEVNVEALSERNIYIII